MDKLKLIHIFVCVADAGSYVAAASRLGLDTSTISKAIARLEQRLHFRLFFRTTRRIRLTPAGTQYLEMARCLLRELEDVEQRLREDNEHPQGVLTLNLPVSYGRLYIMPLLGKFCKLYPDIELSISLDDAYVDLIEQQVDVCIRTGVLSESNVVARKLSPIDFVCCVSPQYLRQCNGQVDLDDASVHPWIRFRYRQSGRLMPIRIVAVDGVRSIDPRRDIVADDGETMSALCAQGLGLTQVPHFLARPWLEREQLKVIGQYYRSPDEGVYIMYPRREFLPAKSRVFIDFLVTEIESLGETSEYTWVEKLPVQ